MERLASCLTEFWWSRILPNGVPIFHAGRPVLLLSDAGVWVAQIRFLSPTRPKLGGFLFLTDPLLIQRLRRGQAFPAFSGSQFRQRGENL
jgi:hypothetical protein